MTDVELLLEANAIKNQTVRGANSAPVVGKMFVDIIENKINNDKFALPLNYSQLAGLASSSSLVAGQNYLINDYRTVHTIPNTSDTNTGNLEPLIVTAVSATALSPIAKSTIYPNDIIYYSLENNASVVTGSLYGYIYRRIDTVQNNDIPFDFRNVKFRRWQLNVTIQDATGAVGNYIPGQIVKKTATNEIYVKLNYKLSVDFSSVNSWAALPFNNVEYCSPTSGNWVISSNAYLPITIPCSSSYSDYKMWASNSIYDTSFNNIFLSPSNSNILTNTNTIFFGQNIQNNFIGGFFYNNSILGNFQNNNFNNYVYNNMIGTDVIKNTSNGFFYNNIVCGQSGNNTFDVEYSSNISSVIFNANKFSAEAMYNTFALQFSGNLTGQYFQRNIFGYSCYKNTIGSSCSNNLIGDNAIANTIASFFINNVIGDGFRQNDVCDLFQGRNFTSSTYVYNSYYCQLVTGVSGYFLIYYDGIQHIVSATA